MKTISNLPIALLLICSFVFPLTSSSQTDAGNLILLTKIMVDNGDMTNVKVEIIQDNKIWEILDNPAKSISHKLPFNHKYTIIYSKPEYVTKRIDVDTHLPEGIIQNGFSPFEYSIRLFKAYDNVDFSVFDKAVGRIRYEEALDDFGYDSEYLKPILPDINNAIDAVERKQEEERQMMVNILYRSTEIDNTEDEVYVSNIRAETSSKIVFITYDLAGDNNQKYDISIYCSTDGGKTWGRRLEKVSGDVGKGTNAGLAKRISWDVLAERDGLQGDNIRFKIIAIAEGENNGNANKNDDSEEYVQGLSYKVQHMKVRSIPKPLYDCNEAGKVVVQIKVNRNGEVVSAKAGYKGTTTMSKCLWEAATNSALKASFVAEDIVTQEQIGSITYSFILQ